MRSISKIPENAYPDHPRIAAGAIVFKENKILLVRRRNPPSKGLWAIPGGSVKLGETLQQAAERETLEETGITVKADKPVLTFDIVERDKNRRIRFHYVVIDLMAKYEHGELKAGDDALDVRWVSADEINRPDVSPKTLQMLKKEFNFGITNVNRT